MTILKVSDVKITEGQLRRIIRQELKRCLTEAPEQSLMQRIKELVFRNGMQFASQKLSGQDWNASGVVYVTGPKAQDIVSVMMSEFGKPTVQYNTGYARWRLGDQAISAGYERGVGKAIIQIE